MAADKPNQIVDQLIDDAKTFGRNKRFLNLIMALVAIAAIFSLLYPFVVAQYQGGPTIESWLPWIVVFIGGGLAMARKQLEETSTTAANIGYKSVLGPEIQVLRSV